MFAHLHAYSLMVASAQSDDLIHSAPCFSRFCRAHSRNKGYLHMTTLHMIHVDVVSAASDAIEVTFTRLLCT
jgi:hypothetical protein